MVPEEELSEALATIEAARRARSFEGERLVKHSVVVPHLLMTLLLGQIWVWYFPVRFYSWREV